MDPLFFGFKRAHLRVVAGTRARIEKHRLHMTGITPARYDMMRVIEAQVDGLPQRNLVELLGVTAQTVSRMLKSLEELHLVERTRMDRDSRCLWVRLTPFGAGEVYLISHYLLDSGFAHRMARLGFGGAEAQESAYRFFRRWLCKIRRAHGDPTPFEEPWRGGELPYPQVFVDDAAA